MEPNINCVTYFFMIKVINKKQQRNLNITNQQKKLFYDTIKNLTCNLKSKHLTKQKQKKTTKIKLEILTKM